MEDSTQVHSHPHQLTKLSTRPPTPYRAIHSSLAPMQRLSPFWNGGINSTLYDSYELRAVTQQLNSAIKKGSQSQAQVPQISKKLKPVHPLSLCLDRVYKENAAKPKRVGEGVGCSQFLSRNTPAKATSRGTSKSIFIPRLWTKIKRTLLSRKQQEKSLSL